MGDYDRILKENIEAILLVLSKKLLGFEVRNPVDLPEKLQTTVEREPDFLKRITLEDGNEVILHLEFQTADEPGMVYRMAEYRAILQRRFKMPVRQFVIYLGADTPKMATRLKPDEVIQGFELRNIHELPVEQVLGSEIPEEIVLSVLADFPKQDAERIIQRIIAKLRRVAPDQAALKKSLQQLVTLSRIRKLEVSTEKLIEEMPITYDIETDYLYQKGIAKGVEKGIEKGIEEGGEQKLRLVIREMAKDSALSLEQIARYTLTSVDYVQEVLRGDSEELKKGSS